MTASEARAMTNSAVLAGINKFDINFDMIYYYIDLNIEEAVGRGQRYSYATVDGCDESWDCVFYKRDRISKHYEDLGYKVTCTGYDRCISADTFVIEW